MVEEHGEAVAKLCVDKECISETIHLLDNGADDALLSVGDIVPDTQ